MKSKKSIRAEYESFKDLLSSDELESELKEEEIRRNRDYIAKLIHKGLDFKKMSLKKEDYLPTSSFSYDDFSNEKEYLDLNESIYVSDKSVFDTTIKNITWANNLQSNSLETKREVNFITVTNNRIKVEDLIISNIKPCFIKDCLGKIVKVSGTFYGYCNVCGSYSYFFTPTPFQEHYINNDDFPILINIGHFGSGKTTMNAAKVARHMLSITNSYVIALAQTLEQLIGVAKVELLKFIPDRLIVKNTDRWLVLNNGSKLKWVASDKEDKLRGYNLTLGWAVEFNEIKYSVLNQIQQRLRNEAGIVYELDENGNKIFYIDNDGIPRPKTIHSYNQLLLESNPDPSSDSMPKFWKRAKMFVSTSIVRPNVEYETHLLPRELGELDIAVYSSSAKDNPFTDKRWADASTSMTGDAHRLFVLADLALEEGQVYHNFNKAIVPVDSFPKIIPNSWPRIFSSDFGGNSSATTMLAGAVQVPEDWEVNEDGTAKQPTLWIYDEYSEVSSATSDHIKSFNNIIYGNPNIVNGIPNMRTPYSVLAIIGDPTGERKNEGADFSIMEQYRNLGIPFQPGYNKKKGSLADLGGLAISNDMLINNVKISGNLYKLIQEGRELKYQVKIAKGVENKNIVMDKVETGATDHLLDAMRMMIVHFYFWLKDRKMLPIMTANQKSINNAKVIQKQDGSYIINASSEVSHGVNFTNNQDESHVWNDGFDWEGTTDWR